MKSLFAICTFLISLTGFISDAFAVQCRIENESGYRLKFEKCSTKGKVRTDFHCAELFRVERDERTTLGRWSQIHLSENGYWIDRVKDDFRIKLFEINAEGYGTNIDGAELSVTSSYIRIQSKLICDIVEL